MKDKKNIDPTQKKILYSEYVWEELGKDKLEFYLFLKIIPLLILGDYSFKTRSFLY